MYLVSIYFDDKTEMSMRQLMYQVSKNTGNTFMQDGDIPPHITLLEFEGISEEKVIEIMDANINDIKTDLVYFASIGILKKQVLYIEPVLNEYLHKLSVKIYNLYKDVQGIRFSPYYKPFGWIPHLSVAKHLDDKQLSAALEVVLNKFVPCEGSVVRIGIAKTNPHRDIKVYTLD